MARACVFCGAAPTTGEHVWPDWIRRKLAIDEVLQHTRLLEQQGEIDRFVFDAQPFKLRVNVVCAECNNGWMARLEESAKCLLEGMIEGRGRELHPLGQKQLASWALLKAMMFDQASPAEARVVFPSLYGDLFEHKQPPDASVGVWLSAYGGDLVGFSALAALEATAGDQPDPGEHNVFVRTFSMGAVLVQVFGTSNPALRDMSVDWAAYGPPPAPPVVQIWPVDGACTWRPEPALNDAGIEWFSNQIIAAFVQQAQHSRD